MKLRMAGAGVGAAAKRSTCWPVAGLAVASAAVMVVLVPAAAGASTTLGSAVGNSGCSTTASVVQFAAVGPNYVVPGTGTLTDWSTDAGTEATNYTARFEVWTPTATPGTYTLDFLSSAQTINAGSGVNTFSLSPPVAVTAGEVIGLSIFGSPNPGECTQITANPADVAGFTSNPPPPVGGNNGFAPFLPGQRQVDVAATFQPTAPPPTTTTTASPTPAAIVVAPRFTG